MEISTHWVGDIPAPLAINVRDSYGRVVDCTVYDSFRVILLGSDNEEVDLTGSSLNTTGARFGRFVFSWPATRSVFTKSGDYVLQLELSGPGKREYTTAQTIRVRQLGKVGR